MPSSRLVPSFDGTHLECRLYNAPSGRQTARARLAIIAHPYGRLGGSFNDHVVMSVTELLAAKGFVVVQFNSRGTGRSQGSPSFSGITEAKDYQAVFEYFIKEVYPLGQHVGVLFAKGMQIQGYSAGALCAVMARRKDNSASDEPTRTAYLLISYPLGVSWALTLFRSTTFSSALAEVCRSSVPVLAIQGDCDQFTGAKNYRNWTRNSQALSPKQMFACVEVNGGDHFWQSHKTELLSSIAAWIGIIFDNTLA